MTDIQTPGFALKSATKGVLLGLAAYACFAFSDAFIKLIEGKVPALQVMAIGAALGMLALPLIRSKDEPWSALVKPKLKGIFAMRLLSGAVNALGAIVAFTYLPMAEAFSLIFLMPIFVTLLSVWVLKEQVGWRRWSAVIVGFIGVLVVLRPGFRDLHLGHFAATVCGLAGAVGVILVRKAGSREHRLTLIGTNMIGNFVIATVCSAAYWIAPSAGQWGQLLGYGLLLAAGNVLIMHATLLAPVNVVAPTQYSQMFWAILLGYTLFDDKVDAVTWLGIAIILAAGLFTVMRNKKSAQQLPRAVDQSAPL